MVSIGVSAGYTVTVVTDDNTARFYLGRLVRVASGVMEIRLLRKMHARLAQIAVNKVIIDAYGLFDDSHFTSVGLEIACWNISTESDKLLRLKTPSVQAIELRAIGHASIA